MKNGYVHHIPGRLRVKIPGIKGKVFMAYRIQDSIGRLAGVHEVTVNSVTGSVLIHYDPEARQPRSLLDALSQYGYIDQDRLAGSDELMHENLTKVGRVVGKAVFGLMVEKAFENSAISLLAALI
jgi:hypothetical protein